MNTFVPTAAIVVQSLVDIDPATYTALKAEDSLLVHSCEVTTEMDEKKWVASGGRLAAWLRKNFSLRYDLTATALFPRGENLANYFPGRDLDDRALAFLNGGDTPPFGFAASGHLIYGTPRQTRVAGGPVASSFSITHAFSRLDYAAAPTVSPSITVWHSPEDPASAALSDEAAATLLRDFFAGVPAFSAADAFTLTLMDGADLIGAPVTLAAWDDITAPASYTHALSHAADIDVPQRVRWERRVTGVRLRRGRLSTDIELVDPLIVPPFHGVRFPAGTLSLTLHIPYATPWDTGHAYLSLSLLSLLGDPSAAIADLFPAETPDLSVRAYDSSDTLLVLFTVRRDPAQWEITPDALVPHADSRATLTGWTGYTDNPVAPPGGWNVAYLSILAPGTGPGIQYTAALGIPEGDPLVLPSPALSLPL